MMRSRGFTLIETVVVIAFSAIMLMTIALLAYNFNKILVYNKAFVKSSGSASALMREVESLTSVASAVLQTHVFSDSTRSSSSTVLVLEIPSIDGSGNVVAGAYDYGAFYSVGTNAYRLLETNALSNRSSGAKQLSSTINSLTFSYNGADFPATSAVTVDIQTQTSAKQEVLSDRLREQVRLRNH